MPALVRSRAAPCPRLKSAHRSCQRDGRWRASFLLPLAENAQDAADGNVARKNAKAQRRQHGGKHGGRYQQGFQLQPGFCDSGTATLDVARGFQYSLAEFQNLPALTLSASSN